MSIDNYIAELETLIASYTIVSSYTLIVDRKTSDIAFISGMIDFKNGFTLDFKEFAEHKGQVVEKYSYAYNMEQCVEKLFFISSYTYCCHSRENGNPAFLICYWMPAPR